MLAYLKRHRKMILCGIFFFYCGCGITLSMLQIHCTDEISKRAIISAENKKYQNIEYAVLILSAPDNENRRNAIRSSWMSLASNIIVENGEKIYKWNSSNRSPHYFISYFFVIGTKKLGSEETLKLSAEHAGSNDLLLLEDLEDSYKSLSEKMLQALVWISENMKDLKYLIKCDDDSFVRVDLIVRDLEAFAPHMDSVQISKYVSYKYDLPSPKGLYWGYFNGHARVYLSGKWQEMGWFLCDNYLPYATGGGYVISKSIVDYIARNSDLLSRYNSEDVSMGVWTASLDLINRVHDIRFDTEWKSRGCSNEMLIRHKQTSSEMLEMYKNLVKTKGKSLCVAESAVRQPYQYKWNVLPVGCCK